MKKKIIVAIADGVGDRPNVELGGLTPLQYAKTPHLDKLAKEGMTGIMDLISPGITVGTDMGHLILFGNPSVNYPGRGPMEAAGVGTLGTADALTEGVGAKVGCTEGIAVEGLEGSGLAAAS